MKDAEDTSQIRPFIYIIQILYTQTMFLPFAFFFFIKA
jgi:hypothetical protein